VCIGNHFALAEAMIILVTLLQNARFELVSRAPLELVPTVTLRPKGPVPMRMQRL
jgi:cytochrome P450